MIASRVLPAPLWNCLLELPNGQRISPDARFADAGLIHKTNGRKFHSPEEAGESVFEDMQRRHDALTAAGLTVLHNSPRRISIESQAVIGQVETCYVRDAGRGLPSGVIILRAGPPGTMWQRYPSDRNDAPSLRLEQ